MPEDLIPEPAKSCPREVAVALLRRAQGPDAARAAAERLPHSIDLRRDAALLRGLGLTREELVEAMGSSP